MLCFESIDAFKDTATLNHKRITNHFAFDAALFEDFASIALTTPFKGTADDQKLGIDLAFDQSSGPDRHDTFGTDRPIKFAVDEEFAFATQFTFDLNPLRDD